ncbi:MATE efflux family protein [Penicillium longicatenatum]|uniref:MATE efflux family protein n=1 Tax=Penicillium longicatenatum TaxID=1561947 RepID=UPI0025469358|nr:MATE efflux family protein [Penicillium longicatenatum]KAJ5631639.1 MATE efflux family protein [Penicillium longicatenatum]
MAEDPYMADQNTPLLVGPNSESEGELLFSPLVAEMTKLLKSSVRLVLVSYLQYCLPFTGLLFVGRLGIEELGAVSLGSSITCITAYGVYQGLCSGMDTLCPLSYGSGRPDLAVLYLRLTLILLAIITVPVAVGWWHSQYILQALVSPKIAVLTSEYLRVSLLGLPGHAVFETGKRFLQAQGVFNPPIYLLCCTVPVNAALHWLVVYQQQRGFIGAPISAALSDTFLGAGLLTYGIYFWMGRAELRSPSVTNAGAHWWKLLRLALPGSITVLAEYLTFELLTLGAGKIDDTSLAAQSLLNATVAIALQLSFAVANSVTLRVATLMGQKRLERTKLHIRVAFATAIMVGLLNMALLMTLRFWISRQISTSVEVQALVVQTMPICAIMQVFYATAEWLNGVMKGLEMQQTAGVLSLICHYTVRLPAG